MRISKLIVLAFLPIWFGSAEVKAGIWPSLRFRQSAPRLPFTLSPTCDPTTLALLGEGSVEKSNSTLEWESKWNLIERYSAPDQVFASSAFRWAAEAVHARINLEPGGTIPNEVFREREVPSLALSLMTSTFPSSLLKMDTDELDRSLFEKKIEELKRQTGLKIPQIEKACLVSRALEQNPHLRNEMTYALNSAGPSMFRRWASGQPLGHEVAELKLSDRIAVEVHSERKTEKSDVISFSRNSDLIRAGITEREVDNAASLEDFGLLVRAIMPRPAHVKKKVEVPFFYELKSFGWVIAATLRQRNGNSFSTKMKASSIVYAPEERMGARAIALLNTAFHPEKNAAELKTLTGLTTEEIAEGMLFARSLRDNPALVTGISRVLDGLSGYVKDSYDGNGFVHLAVSHLSVPFPSPRAVSPDLAWNSADAGLLEGYSRFANLFRSKAFQVVASSLLHRIAVKQSPTENYLARQVPELTVESLKAIFSRPEGVTTHLSDGLKKRLTLSDIREASTLVDAIKDPDVSDALVSVLRKLGPTSHAALARGENILPHLKVMQLASEARDDLPGAVTNFSEEKNPDLERLEIEPHEIKNFASLDALSLLIRTVDPKLRNQDSPFPAVKALGWSLGAALRRQWGSEISTQYPPRPKYQLAREVKLGSWGLRLMERVFRQATEPMSRESRLLTGLSEQDFEHGKNLVALLDRNPSLRGQLERVLNYSSEIGFYRAGLYPFIIWGNPQGDTLSAYDVKSNLNTLLFNQPEKKTTAVSNPPAPAQPNRGQVPVAPGEVSVVVAGEASLAVPRSSAERTFSPPVVPTLEWRNTASVEAGNGATYDHREATSRFSAVLASRVRYALSKELWGDVDEALSALTQAEPPPFTLPEASSKLQPALILTIRKLERLKADLLSLQNDGAEIAQRLRGAGFETQPNEVDSHQSVSLTIHEELRGSVPNFEAEISRLIEALDGARALVMGGSSDLKSSPFDSRIRNVLRNLKDSIRDFRGLEVSREN